MILQCKTLFSIERDYKEKENYFLHQLAVFLDLHNIPWQ